MCLYSLSVISGCWVIFWFFDVSTLWEKCSYRETSKNCSKSPRPTQKSHSMNKAHKEQDKSSISFIFKFPTDWGACVLDLASAVSFCLILVVGSVPCIALPVWDSTPLILYIGLGYYRILLVSFRFFSMLLFDPGNLTREKPTVSDNPVPLKRKWVQHILLSVGDLTMYCFICQSHLILNSVIFVIHINILGQEFPISIIGYWLLIINV